MDLKLIQFWEPTLEEKSELQKQKFHMKVNIYKDKISHNTHIIESWQIPYNHKIKKNSITFVLIKCLSFFGTFSYILGLYANNFMA